MPCSCCNPEACDACPPCPECAEQAIWTYAYQMGDMPKPELNSLRSYKGDKSYWRYYDCLASWTADRDQPDTKIGPVQRITDPCPETLG